MRPYGYDVHFSDLWDWPDPTHKNNALHHSRKVKKCGERQRVKLFIQQEIDEGHYGPWTEQDSIETNNHKNRYEPYEA